MKKQNKILKPEKKIDNYVWCPSAYLGSGPWGQVYKGIDIRTKSPVAIKILFLEEFPSINKLSEITDEVSYLKQIVSSHLVSVHDVFFNKKNLYVIQEYCHEGDLRKIFSFFNKRLSEPFLFQLFKQLFYVMQELQTFECINCDLKPENLMVFYRDGSLNLKMTDFWIPRINNLFSIEKSNGLRIYSSPQILNNEIYTNKCWVWSLALILFEAIFGKLPWFGVNSKDLIENIQNIPLKFPYRIAASGDLKNFLRSCLEYSEKKRLGIKEIMKYFDVFEDFLKKKSKVREFDDKTHEILKNMQSIITKNNINLDSIIEKDKIFNENKKVFLSDFQIIIRILDKNIDSMAIQLFYESLDPNSEGISIQEFKNLLSESDFSTYDNFENPFLEEKAERVAYCLRETIRRNKIDIDLLFRSFDVSGNAQLNNTEFEQLLISMNPRITHLESQYLFQKLDYDKSGDIDINEFKCYILRDLKSEQRYKNLENLFHVIMKDFKNLIMSQNMKIDKVFEKFCDKIKKKIFFDEFSKFLKVLQPKLQPEEIEYIFQRVDISKKGFLTKENFSQIFLT